MAPKKSEGYDGGGGSAFLSDEFSCGRGREVFLEATTFPFLFFAFFHLTSVALENCPFITMATISCSIVGCVFYLMAC